MRAIRSGLAGARDGISAANKVVTGAKVLDAAMDAANMSGIQRRVDAAARGVPPPESRMDRAVQGYAAGKTAHRMGSYFAHTNPEERLGRAQQAHMRTNMVLGAPLEQQRQDQPPRTSESCSPE